jgi:hypothetical protein
LKVNPKGVWDPPKKMNVGHARPTAAGMGGVAGWASPAMGAAKPDKMQKTYQILLTKHHSAKSIRQSLNLCQIWRFSSVMHISVNRIRTDSVRLYKPNSYQFSTRISWLMVNFSSIIVDRQLVIVRRLICPPLYVIKGFHSFYTSEIQCEKALHFRKKRHVL